MIVETLRRGKGAGLSYWRMTEEGWRLLAETRERDKRFGLKTDSEDGREFGVWDAPKPSLTDEDELSSALSSQELLGVFAYETLNALGGMNSVKRTVVPGKADDLTLYCRLMFPLDTGLERGISHQNGRTGLVNHYKAVLERILVAASHPDLFKPETIHQSWNRVRDWVSDLSDSLIYHSYQIIRLFGVIGLNLIEEEYRRRDLDKKEIPLPSCFGTRDAKSQTKGSEAQGPHPDGSEGSPPEVPTFKLIGLLSDTEKMRAIFPEFEPRLEQVQYTKDVSDALIEGDALVCEAGTGVGKSIAYLLPAALFSMNASVPVVVSTSTLTLQNQLINKDIPLLERMLGTPLKFEVVKGRSHYLCKKMFFETLIRHSDQSINRLREIASEREESLPLEDEAHSVNGKSSVTNAEQMTSRDLTLKSEDRRTMVGFMLVFLLFWAEASDDLDLEMLPTAPYLDLSVQKRLLSHFAFRQGSARACSESEFSDSCAYTTLLTRAKSANIVVMNHALVFSHFFADPEALDPFLRGFPEFIFDEAHDLEDCITNQAMRSIHGKSLINLANDILRILRSREVREGLKGEPLTRLTLQESGKRIENNLIRFVDAVNEISDGVEELFRAKVFRKEGNNTLSFITGSEKERIANFKDSLWKLRNIQKDLNSAVSPLFRAFSDRSSPLYLKDQFIGVESLSAAKTLEDTGEVLDLLLREEEDLVKWVSSTYDVGPDWFVNVTKADISDDFVKFAEGIRSLILTSATLAVNGKFGFLKERLGLNRINQRVRDVLHYSPFDYAKQVLCLIPSDIGSYDVREKEVYFNAVEKALPELVDTVPGGVLILFTSVGDMIRTYERTRRRIGQLGRRALCQNVSGSREFVTETFRVDEESVLFGTKTYWQGVDVMGAALQCVVIVKLPFAFPMDPIEMARAKRAETILGGSFVNYSLPRAVVLFRQGVGRLIRHRSDYGIIAILDGRVLTGSYGKSFLRSLPEMRIETGSLSSLLRTAGEWLTRKAHTSS